MDGSDWEYMLSMVEDERNKIIIPPYRGSPRENLDREIGNILSGIKIDAALGEPFSHRCDTGFGIYDHCRHTLNRQEVSDGSFLGSPGQVCAAFYHIHEGQKAASAQRCLCLDSHSCLTSRKSRKLKGLYDRPKPTMAVVKCEVDGAIAYEARYTDCYGFGVSAEEFFARDARRGDLRAVIDRGRTVKVTLYTTWPPSDVSASDPWNSRDYNCCKVIVDLNSSHFKPKNIQFSVKLASVYTEGRPQHEEKVHVEIKILLENGILVTRMGWIDWDYLLSIVRFSPAHYTPPGSEKTAWEWKSRNMLDQEIGEFLYGIKQKIIMEKWKYIVPLLGNDKKAVSKY